MNRDKDVAAPNEVEQRYAIYTATPVAEDLAHTAPLIRAHRTLCEETFARFAQEGHVLAATPYDDAIPVGSRLDALPAFERLAGHVEARRIHVVILITAVRARDVSDAVDPRVARLIDAGAEVINCILVDLGEGIAAGQA